MKLKERLEEILPDVNGGYSTDDYDALKRAFDVAIEQAHSYRDLFWEDTGPVPQADIEDDEEQILMAYEGKK